MSTGRQLGIPEPQLHGLHVEVLSSHFAHVSGFLQAAVHLSTGKQAGSPNPQSHVVHVPALTPHFSHFAHLPAGVGGVPPQAAVH